MRYLILMALALSTTSAGTSFQAYPPKYEYPACPSNNANLYMILPEGTVIDVMRIETVGPNLVQVVGYAPRLFCDTFEG